MMSMMMMIMVAMFMMMSYAGDTRCDVGEDYDHVGGVDNVDDVIWVSFPRTGKMSVLRYFFFKSRRLVSLNQTILTTSVDLW